MTLAYTLRPSGADIWGFCSGAAAKLAADTAERKETRDGTAAHWVGYSMLCAAKVLGAAPPASSFIGKTCPENGVIIDEEHAEGAQVYADYVLDVWRGIGGELLIEQFVTAHAIHPQNEGTLDAAVVNVKTRTVAVIDYKHGHAEVSPMSLQLIDYLAGLRERYRIDGSQDQHWAAELHVVQPNCYQKDGDAQSVTGMLSDFRGYFNQLHAAAWKVENNPELSSGPHCLYCPALWECPAVREYLYRIADHVKNPPDFDDMDPAAMAVERSILQTAEKLTRARREAIEDVITENLKNGGTGYGLTLQSTPGRLKWSVPPEQVIALGQMAGVDLRSPKALTPTQAIAKKPELEKVLLNKASRPASLKLINQKDSRTAQVFAKRK